MFDIGEKIICVDDSFQPDTAEEIKKDIPNWVKKDQKYTVRAILNNNGIVTGILLEEIQNPWKYFRLINKFQEPAFAEWRFRKLKPSEQEEEIESLTKEQFNKEFAEFLN